VLLRSRFPPGYLGVQGIQPLLPLSVVRRQSAEKVIGTQLACASVQQWP
jgi:hypothetical protein